MQEFTGHGGPGYSLKLCSGCKDKRVAPHVLCCDQFWCHGCWTDHNKRSTVPRHVVVLFMPNLGVERPKKAGPKQSPENQPEKS